MGKNRIAALLLLAVAAFGSDINNGVGNAATATALASNPADCDSGKFAIAIAANGDLTCDTPAGGSVSAPWTLAGGTASGTDYTVATIDAATGSASGTVTGLYLPAQTAGGTENLSLKVDGDAYFKALIVAGSGDFQGHTSQGFATFDDVFTGDLSSFYGFSFTQQLAPASVVGYAGSSGFYTEIRSAASDSHNYGYITGSEGYVRHRGSGDVEYLTGVNFAAGVDSTGGSITYAYGGFFNAFNNGAGIISEGSAVELALSNNGSGSITLGHGLKVQDIHATTAYAIHTNQTSGANSWAYYGAGTAKAHFGGNIDTAGALIVTNPTTPASSSDTCITGTIAWDSSYVYVCVATDTWKRMVITTW